MRSRIGFLRDFLNRFLEVEFIRGRLTPSELHELQSTLSAASLTDFRNRLFSSHGGSASLATLKGTFRLLELREPDLRRFPFLQYIRKRRARPARARQLRCFVGHRFQPQFERSLRYNLRHILEPYQIRIGWAGMDLNSDSLFEEVVSGIRSSDFCIFDNLGTLNRPNVYIEAGIAYAVRKPFILCEYIGRTNAIRDTGSMPADLNGLLRVQYKSYRDLCEQLYFGLPEFLQGHQLR